MSHWIGSGVIVRIVRSSVFPCAGLASASITTTPVRVTTNPALERPSDPCPVSPSTAYAPGAELANGIGADRVGPLARLPAGERGRGGGIDGERGRNLLRLRRNGREREKRHRHRVARGAQTRGQRVMRSTITTAGNAAYWALRYPAAIRSSSAQAGSAALVEACHVAHCMRTSCVRSAMARRAGMLQIGPRRRFPSTTLCARQ